MKMLFVTYKYPPSVGGMENHCFELHRGLKKVYDNIHLMKYDGKGSRLIWLLTLPGRIRKFLRAHPDTTHVYFHDGLTGMIAKSVKRTSQAEVFTTYHGLDVVYPLKMFQDGLKEVVTRYTDVVIPVSKATAEELVQRGAPPEKVHVIPNGIDHSIMEVPEEKDYYKKLEKRLGISLEGKKAVVSIGRAVKRKGFSWFIKNVVPGLNRNIIYLMIGPIEPNISKTKRILSLLPRKVAYLLSLMGVGIDQVEINKLLEKPEFKERVFQLGKVTYNDLIQILKFSDAFVMPNKKVYGDAEGFGLVALEAVLSGTAVLVSGIEGITEAVIDGENGIHIEAENPKEWIEKINHVCRNEKERNSLIKKSIDYTRKNYSWEKMCREYVRVFESQNGKKRTGSMSIQAGLKN
jgi:phosphatidylinositol alpha-1,6-mannosyltransferase